MSLPKQFDQLRDILRYGKSTLSLEEFISVIHSKQLELGANGKANKTQGEGLYTNTSNRGRPATRDEPKDKRKGRFRYKSKGKKYTCWMCDNEDHFKKDCPKKGQNKKDQDKGEAVVATRNDFVESLVEAKAYISKSTNFNERWILDTWCTYHMTPRNDLFVELKEFDAGSVRMANDSLSEVKGISTVRVQTSDGMVVLIKGVRYVPTYTRNLLSLGNLNHMVILLVQRKV